MLLNIQFIKFFKIKIMTTIKLKYLLGTIIMGLITLYTYVKDDKYSVIIPIIYLTITTISFYLLIKDKYTHAVTNESGDIVKKFDNEKDAIEFADNQDMNVKVLMMHIK